MESGGTAILYGNLAPDGAVIKTSAADPRLLTHTGPAAVFQNFADMETRIDLDSLQVDENSVLVLLNAGPQGGPGMPEWGMLPIPKKLLRRGIRDMVRISDARMSGTAYGTCVLHVSPESFVGGPLALVRTGDSITLDVPNHTLNLLVSEEELTQRRAAWQPPPSPTNAATRPSTAPTSPRPTRAATSTSSNTNRPPTNGRERAPQRSRPQSSLIADTNEL